MSASLAALDAIGLRACALLREHGVVLAATVGLHGEASEIRVRAPLNTTGESWGYGAGDLATAAQMVAHRLGHADVVRWIDGALDALRRAPTLRPEGDGREVRTG